MWQWVLPGEVGGALTDGLAETRRDDWPICVVLPPETASMTPRVRPSAIGMAREPRCVSPSSDRGAVARAGVR